MKIKLKLLYLMVIFFTINNNYGQTVNKATINPLEKFGRVTKYHMLDMNHNPGSLNNIGNAETAFGEAKMNSLRVPLYCGDYYGGHPEEGVVVESVYTTVLESIENAKASYNGTEPFMIFAGLKVNTSDKAEYFPDWVTTEEPTVANPLKYAQLVVDFIEFMHGKGHTIDAFAFDKEAARMDVEDFKIAVDELKARTASLGYVVPRIVAPELYKPLGENGPLDELYDINGEDRFDVFGNHYYLNHHNATNHPDLKYEYELAQSDKYREAWATEAHWDKIRCSLDYEKESDIWTSELAIGCMFDWTDLGLDLVSWWDYPLSGGNSPRHYIMRAYTESLIGSQPIRMLDHDGEEVISRLKLHSRAYIRDNEVNVFFINAVSPCNTSFTPPFYEEYPVEILEGFTIDGDISVTRWDDDDQPAGESFIIESVEENQNQFLLDIPTGSFTHVSFKINEPKPNRVYIDHVATNVRLRTNDAATDVITSGTNETGSKGFWDIVDAGNGYYYVQNVANGKKLQAMSTTLNDEASVRIINSSFTGNLVQWEMIPIGDNWFIQNKQLNTRLNINNSQEVSVGQSSWNGPFVQWKLTAVDENSLGFGSQSKSSNSKEIEVQATSKLTFPSLINSSNPNFEPLTLLENRSNYTLNIYGLDGKLIFTTSNMEEAWIPSGKQKGIFIFQATYINDQNIKSIERGKIVVQ
ncbi:hypothetical protein Q4Q35_02720 [Flavivirga aquimarina]|uniref:Ricin B lectin domain-containing protein n=1 Tax=Flavivirga aquimarina TaxID=2027862 RepID=A0ABT8W6G7_9FLAO|nr:hypothetical protein [Flavivirga aquimarina]MDO5968711.1 hypothetical protein [Flavivirga aquimarina]